jgi:ABC-2 type transport system permease protein
MHNIWTIAKREYSQYFISPVAYIIAFIILLILGIIFYANILAGLAQQFAPDITIVLGPMVTLLLFTTPAVTMRTLADEQRMGTMELLLTAPIKDWELVVGKWLGAFLFYLSLILVTWVFPLILNRLISPGIDQGLLLAGYLGIVLMVAAMIAVGVAMSSLFTNQIAAFFATIGVLLVMWMIAYPIQQATGTGADILRYLDLSSHFYNTFYVGVVELKDVVYYLSLTALGLFLGTMSIEVRRWR